MKLLVRVVLLALFAVVALATPANATPTRSRETYWGSCGPTLSKPPP